MISRYYLPFFLHPLDPSSCFFFKYLNVFYYFTLVWHKEFFSVQVITIASGSPLDSDVML